MTVDRSCIPTGVQKQNRSLLDGLEVEALAKLADPVFRWGTCCHEAAHWHMRQRVGATNLKFLGPHFVWDEKNQTVQTTAGGVSSDFEGFVSFRDMAKYCVAGYLWEGHITQSPPDSESAAIDRRIFEEDVRKFAPPHTYITEEQIEATWQWAVGEIRKDLDNPEIREHILKLAQEFQIWLEEQL